MNSITYQEAAEFLRAQDHYLILTHKRPDGDTIGCAAALCRGLRALGKTAHICPGTGETHLFTPYLEGLLAPADYEPETVVSVDIAARGLFTAQGEKCLARGIDLAIDHHRSQEFFARKTCVDAGRAACGELIYDILKELGAVTAEMAAPLYVAISTDSGCFQYSNTTAGTHRIAADLLERGARGADINRAMFESKSKAQVEAERLVMDTLRFSSNGLCALVQVPWGIFSQTGAQESDLDGVASLPREIQGVVLGGTLKEKAGGKVKVSLRANPPADASALCARFGGGGHQGAAGCTLETSLERAVPLMEEACAAYVKELGLL